MYTVSGKEVMGRGYIPYMMPPVAVYGVWGHDHYLVQC